MKEITNPIGQILIGLVFLYWGWYFLTNWIIVELGYIEDKIGGFIYLIVGLINFASGLISICLEEMRHET